MKRNNCFTPRSEGHDDDEGIFRTDHGCGEGKASHLQPGSTEHESVSSDSESLDSSKTSKQSSKISHNKKNKATKKTSKFWKKPRDKPKRPLSSYNIFFKHTRSRIINGDDEEATPEEVTRAAVEAIVANSTQPRVPRSNRKTHGQIGFGDLAREIASRWKVLDTETRAIYDHYASLDMQRYRSEIAAWKAKMERQAIANAERARVLDGNAHLDERQSNQNESIEWTRVQPRSLETSFDSSASEETEYSIDQNFSTEASSQMKINRPFPSSFVIPSHQEYCDSNKMANPLPSFCPSSRQADNTETRRNCDDRIDTIAENEAKMKNLQLMEDIIHQRKDILMREKQLCVMKASLEKEYSSFVRDTPSFPTGPSLQRMQQLHFQRMIKEDSLAMRRRISINNSRKGDYLSGRYIPSNSNHSVSEIVDNACEITSDSIHTINSKISEGCMDIDPVPLTDVFTISAPDFY